MGHLGRTLALAEALAAQGDEVCVALSRTHARLRQVLPARVRVAPTLELPPAHTPRGGLLASLGEGGAADQENLARSGQTPRREWARRNERLKAMLARDAEILAAEQPDAIVVDGRATPVLLKARQPLFHLANWLGYASFMQRVRGAPPFPLGEGQLLIPGVEAIEGRADRPGMFFGPMVWAGWTRLSSASPPGPSDILLSFGSTGEAGRLAPWLARNLPGRYRVSALGAVSLEGRPDAAVFPAGPLAPHLALTRVVLCHGGHGTVMESLLNGRPLIVFPRNIEQLEIGRRIQRLGLGRLVDRPRNELEPARLEAMIESLVADPRVHAELARVSALLRAQSGAAGAAAALREALPSA